jgi:regulatory protein
MARRTGQERLEARRARLERHAAETDPAVVMSAAAWYLELRSRSVEELRRRLLKSAFPEVLVEQTLDRLVEVGILDDRAFASAWVESRDRARPRGQTALRRELTLKGIDRELIASILEARSDAAAAALDEDGPGGGASADQLAAERLMARSRAALLRVADPRARRNRAYAMLARHGFDPEVCRVVSASVIAADETSEDE